MTTTAVAKTLIIVAMTACFSMIFLNESGAIAVTFPQMQQALNLSNGAINWIMNGFLLTAATLLLLGGKLSDHYGRRRIFMIGLVIFLIASSACALSQNAEVMIGARVLQAIGASLIYPSGSALIGLCFPQNEFNKAYGTIIGFAYFFVAFGPFVGGVFTDFLNWRYIFWINVPICVLCFFLAWRVIPRDVTKPPYPPLDFKGLITLIIGLGAIVLALMEGDHFGWFSLTTIGLLIIGVVFLLIFGTIELNTATPLLEIRLFKNHSFLAGNIIFPCTAACFTALIFWAIWLQQTFNYSPVWAGIAMIPATAISIFMLRVSGAWGSKAGPSKPMLLGAFLLVLGIFWIAITAEAQSYWLLVWGFLFFGFGTPLIIPNSIGIIMHSVKPEQHGIASGVYLTLQHVAFSLGFAVLAAVITTYNDHAINQLLQTTPSYAGIQLQQVHLLLAGKNTITQLNSSGAAELKQAAATIYTQAFSRGMAAIGIFAMFALLFSISYALKHRKTSESPS